MNEKSLLNIGHTTYDTFLILKDAEVSCDINKENCKIAFRFGDKIPVDNITYGLGGGAANVAIGTSFLGIDSYIHTILGSDLKSEYVMKAFKKYKVLPNFIFDDVSPTDQASIISFNGERTILTYNCDREYELVKEAKEFSNIFVSSIGEKVRKLYLQIEGLKRQKPNINIFYNPGTKELKYSYNNVLSFIPFTDTLIANVDEGIQIVDRKLSRNDITIKDLLMALYKKGIKNVVLTDSENGAYLLQKKVKGFPLNHSKYSKLARVIVENDIEVVHIKALPTKVVEKTGAGDAFSSGFISAKIHKKDSIEALIWGSLNSSALIKKVGAQEALLDYNSMQNELKKF